MDTRILTWLNKSGFTADIPGLDPAMSFKYAVQRRDGTIPEWPYFVLGAADPYMPTALRAYAAACEKGDLDPDYVAYLRGYADYCDQWRTEHSGTPGDPDAPRHRADNADTLRKMSDG